LESLLVSFVLSNRWPSWIILQISHILVWLQFLHNKRCSYITLNILSCCRSP
jgi:hypothetical protein